MPVLSTREFFDENIKLMGPMAHQKDPLTFNLYKGLAELCDDVQKLGMQVDDIKRMLAAH